MMHYNGSLFPAQEELFRIILAFLQSPKCFVSIKNGIISVDMNAQDARGETILHHAVQWEDVDVIDLLLNNGVNPNIADNNGLTPIYYSKCCDVFKCMLRCGAIYPMKSISDYELLSRFLHDNGVGCLIDAGADINAKNADGQTLLHEVVLCDDEAALYELLDYYPNLHAVDIFGNTPVSLAREVGGLCLQQLIRRGYMKSCVE